MIDKNCDVQVGTHSTPYWVDLHSGHKVCSRHKLQYETREEDFGPYEWVNVGKGD
jgi:hypothetical protein